MFVKSCVFASLLWHHLSHGGKGCLNTPGWVLKFRLPTGYHWHWGWGGAHLLGEDEIPGYSTLPPSWRGSGESYSTSGRVEIGSPLNLCWWRWGSAAAFSVVFGWSRMVIVTHFSVLWSCPNSGPPTTENRLFSFAPVGISRLLPSLAPRLGYTRPKENPKNTPSYHSLGSRVPRQLSFFLFTFQSSYVCFIMSRFSGCTQKEK